MESEYFAEQAHRFFRMALASRDDPYLTGKLNAFARAFAIRSVSLGARPERLEAILFAPGALVIDRAH